MKKQILLIILFFCGCSIHEKTVLQPSGSQLMLLDQFHTEVAEPSGLSLDKSHQFLWTVSDPPTNRVYKIDLTGKIRQTLDYVGDDLEGIAYDSVNEVLWVTEEEKRELVKISPTGAELERHAISFTGHSNAGFEGITITANGKLWTVNEKNPPKLIQLNADFSIKATFDPGIATDYSGICADTTAGRFWVVSDESQLLFLWDKEKGVIEQYSLPLKKAEGIAIDFIKGLFYIVSDSEQKLYIFQIID